MTTEKLLQRLQKPTGPVDAVLDTDTYNEVDDQYALAYLLRSPEQVRMQAIYAAPFWNERSVSPEDGMEKSYDEILHILSLLGAQNPPQVLKGSPTYLPDETHAVDSPAARDLIRRALAQPEERPLYVVAIGAITNVASALLLAPEIKEKIVVVWLGGHALDWENTKEFNLYQDVAAARVIFDCGVPVVQLPCMGVASGFTITQPELEYWLKGKNPLCDYLVGLTVHDTNRGRPQTCWSRVLWDVTAAAWLMGKDFLRARLEPSPVPEYDGYYSLYKYRHFIQYVYWVNRDPLMWDLIQKLSDNV